ncbi:hypothetical protein FHL15_007600 [Xylaria flabelliformis]|uniref:DUF7708 domain-containing protein n=1 Tax=Xylaria flabelliformis TaxID=2512241 RepID=A0A553HUG8_9PEZI|nr:hypothetical protein FHL15_007600 [Xylaria flabelliformis]
MDEFQQETTAIRYQVLEFIPSRLDGSTDEALDGTSKSMLRINPSNGCWEPSDTCDHLNFQEIYHECFEARDVMLATINRYLEKQGQPAMQLNAYHDWTEVEDTLTFACNQLDKTVFGRKGDSHLLGRMKVGFQSLCRHAKTAQTFISFIPSDFMCSSVLTGGLKAIFTALEKTGSHRQEIQKALVDIPEILDETTFRMRVHQYSEELHRKSAKLFAAVLRVMSHILRWLCEKTIKTGAKMLLSPSHYPDKLKDLMADLELKAQHFQYCALTLSQGQQNRMERLQHQSLVTQVAALHGQDAAHQKLDTVINMLERRLEVLEGIQLLFEASGRKYVIQTRNTEHDGRQCSFSVKDSEVDKNTVWRKFQYDKSLVEKDCRDLIPKRGTRIPLDRNRIDLIETGPLLRGWLGLNRPYLLLLNGRSRRRQRSEVSAVIARTCLELLSHAEGNEVLITLCFFCGQHSSTDDPLGNANEIILNLLSQLVDQYDQFASEDLLGCFENTDPGEVESVADSFQKLLEKLPRRYIVVIVVDGLSFFATPRERQRETRTVVERLIEIWRAIPAAMLKLLFSSPTHAEFVEDLFESHEILNLPREVRRNGRRQELRKGSSLSTELTRGLYGTDTSEIE